MSDDLLSLGVEIIVYMGRNMINIDEENVISAGNVQNYIDETCDGGYWYTVKDGEPKFVAITDKALKLFGYNNIEEVCQRGETPHTLIKPILGNKESEKQYWEFINGKLDRFYMDCSFKNSSGEEYYGELFIAHSLVFPHAKDESLFRVMIHIFSTTDAIFRQSKQLLDKMNSGVIILEKEDESKYTLRYGNEGFCNAYNWDSACITDHYGESISNIIYDEDYESVVETLDAAVSTGENKKNTYRLVNDEGDFVWVKAEHKMVHIGSNTLIYVNFVNITDLMDIQNEMKEANGRLTSFINHTPAGIIVFEKITDEYVIAAINKTFLNKLNVVHKKHGVELTREDFIGESIENVIKYVDPIDKLLVIEAISIAEKDGEAECKFKLDMNMEGSRDVVWIHTRAISRKRTNGNQQLIAVYNDITKQMKAELEVKSKQAKILNLSYHDALTDVLNRQSYNELMKQRGRDSFKNTGVAFVDLNGLKVINDMYGHSKGDDAIKLTVLLMEHYFDKDEIYRFSGDNFVIIKENISQEKFYGYIGKLICEFNKYDIASIGYVWDDNIENINHNIEKAEATMRVAKQDYYLRHQEDVSKYRPVHLDDLMQDINNGKYLVYLQPKAYTNSQKTVAAEALIRRKEKDGSISSPIEFVPTFEKERLIPYLDFYMLKETCKIIERWNKENRYIEKVSVNMSRVTFTEPDYIAKVLEITDSYDIEHSQIEFEITESQETMDRHLLEQIVSQLSEQGFGVSLDDMGTEYASVMMLTMQGIDTVKIDKGFLLQIKNAKGKLLVEHIIQMCHDLGELCIAEGVEDDETRKMLLEMGCDMYQGYLLSKPIPVIEFEKLLDSDTIKQ